MSEISGTPPTQKPAAISSQGPQKVPGRESTRDNTTANDQNPSPKEGQVQASRSAEGARFDTAVQLSPTMAHLNVGDVIRGEISHIDGEGRPVLDTPQASYAIEPHAGLKAKMAVEVVVKDVERKALGDLISRDGVKLEAPVTLTLTVTVLHGLTPPSQAEGQIATPQTSPPPSSQVYHASPNAAKMDNSSHEAAFLAEIGSRPRTPTNTQGPEKNPEKATTTDRAIPTPQRINSAIATILNAVGQSDKGTSPPPNTAFPDHAKNQSVASAPAGSQDAPVERLPQGIVLAQLVNNPDGKSAPSPMPAFVALNVTPQMAGDSTATEAAISTVGGTMTAVVRALDNHEEPPGNPPPLPHTAMVLDTPKGAFRLITPLSGAKIGNKMNVLILDVPLPDLWNTQSTGAASPQAPKAPEAPKGIARQHETVVQTPASPQNTVAAPSDAPAASTLTAKSTTSPSTPTAPADIAAPPTPNMAAQPANAQAVQAPPASMPAVPAFMPIADYLNEWPMLEQLQSAVALADPSASGALNARIPSATPQLAGAALFFLSALGLQNPRAWVGSKVEGALEKAGGGNWLDKLSEEFVRLRVRTEAATGQAMEWRPHVVPFKTDDGVNAFIVFDRPKDDEQKDAHEKDSEAPQKGQEKKRFVVALNLKNLGPFELDALWNKNIIENTGKLDLLVRVGSTFDKTLKNNLKAMALTTLEASGLSGSLRFEDIANSPLHSKELLGRIEQSLHHENRVI